MKFKLVKRNKMCYTKILKYFLCSMFAADTVIIYPLPVGKRDGERSVQLSASHVALLRGIVDVNCRIDAQAELINTFTTRLSEARFVVPKNSARTRSLAAPQQIISGRFDGRVNTPSICAGVGFSVTRLNNGRYRIVFDEPFTSIDYMVYVQGLSCNADSEITTYVACPIFSTYTVRSFEIVAVNQMLHRQDDTVIDFMVFGPIRTE